MPERNRITRLGAWEFGVGRFTAEEQHQLLVVLEPHSAGMSAVDAKRAPVLAAELCSLWGLTPRNSRETIAD
jgi:hypothetical protein